MSAHSPDPASIGQLRDVPAPAKVNLFLHVTGRRPDGYHLLQTAFRFVDLCDTLHFATRQDGRIVRVNDVAGVPADDDLVVRAARLLQQETNTTLGADIELVKRIPMGGGMGGGSSDAATVLLALNRLWGCGLTREALMAIGLRLGADVPVFVFGHNAFAEGIGEELRELPLPERWYVVIQPDASVPTADIFRSSELTRDTAPLKIADFSASANFSACRNDLEAVAFSLFPEVARVAGIVSAALEASFGEQGGDHIAAGMEGVVAEAMAKPFVRMSGSGACLFVEVGDQATAQRVADEVDRAMSQQAPELPRLRLNRVCAGLGAHPLLDWSTPTGSSPAKQVRIADVHQLHGSL